MKWRETNIVPYGNYAIWFNLLANKTVGSCISQFLLYISLCFRDFSGGLLTRTFIKQSTNKLIKGMPPLAFDTGNMDKLSQTRTMK